MKPLLPHEIDKLMAFDLFRALDRAQVENALLEATIKNVKHREYIIRVGDPSDSFWVVVDGTVKLIRHSPRGEDIIMHFAVPGDVVGALLMNQNDGSAYPISAKAMGPGQVIRIPRTTFLRFWRPDVNIQGHLNAMLYRRMKIIQDDKTMSTSPLKVRIANLLMRHLDRDAEDFHQSLSLHLTRQEIADSLGVAVESVIRTMREWQEDRTIYRLPERDLEIIDVKKLLKNLIS